LFIIDREPPEELAKTTANWLLSTAKSKEDISLKLTLQMQIKMTEKTAAGKTDAANRFHRQGQCRQSSRLHLLQLSSTYPAKTFP
jgi:hypothetical protein